MNQLKKLRKKPRARVATILDRLAEHHGDAECALVHESPLQLLVATILSAQCTDERVNKVTPDLFRRFPDAQAFAEANPRSLEAAIRTTGFFKNKAKNIRSACRALIENHEGKVPSTLEELVALPGVGRKTANVVLGNAFDIPGITVDTHVGRVSRRLGLTREEDPVKVEFELMKIIPQPQWTHFSHQMIWHGRRICSARKPLCSQCFLRDMCPFPDRELRVPARTTASGSRSGGKVRSSSRRREVP